MKTTLLSLALIVLMLSACNPQTAILPVMTPLATRAGTLQPYKGPTPTITPSPTNPATLTPLPTATPTPRTHIVSRNQDFFGIAWMYGVTLEDLISANPDINPRAMRVGEELRIPAPLYTPTLDPNNPPLPTPVSLILDQPNCSALTGGGVWCFSSANNQQRFSIEGLTAVIHLHDQESGEILTQPAYPPLNLLSPGGSLPLAAYFPPPTALKFEASIELVSALPVPPDSGRYLALTDRNLRTQISEDGLSAEVSGELALTDSQTSAASVLVAAVAFDESEKVIGIRLWQSENPLEGEQTLAYHLVVYSTGAPITRVAVIAEATP